MVWWCWFRRDKTDQSVIYFKKYEIKTGLKVKGLAAQLLCGSTVISATVPHLGWFLLVPLVAVPGVGAAEMKVKTCYDTVPANRKTKTSNEMTKHPMDTRHAQTIYTVIFIVSNSEKRSDAKWDTRFSSYCGHPRTPSRG